MPQDLGELFHSFHSGIKKFNCIWQEILKQDTYLELEKVFTLSRKSFIFSAQLWAKIIYDYILFYHRFKHTFIEMSMPLVLESMIPLYFGFISSFVLHSRDMSNQEAEEEIERISVEFEKLKSYLIENWNKRE